MKNIKGENKMAKTREQVPWAEYMVIDEDLNYSLSLDAPQEIKEKYEAYQKEITTATKSNEFIVK